METKLLIDVVGWIGAALLLLAYALVSAGRIRGVSISFQILNILGSIGLVANTISLKAYPSAAVNIIWIGIGFVAVSRVMIKTPATAANADLRETNDKRS